MIYDLERTLVIEVPKRFRNRIPTALATGVWGPALTRWFADETLLTSDARTHWAEGSAPALPEVTDFSIDMSGACNLGCTYCFENEIGSRIGPMQEETALASLDFIFGRASASPRIVLHFGSGEPLLRFDLLQKIVAEADRRGKGSGRKVTYELTTNATLVTEEIASFLEAHPFNVRVSCDGPPSLHDAFRPFRGGQSSYSVVEKGLKLLLAHLPDRLTVNSVLSGGTRLSALWGWAKEIGVRRYHVIKVGAEVESDLALREEALRDFRSDLLGICDDLYADLEGGRVPIDYQPITKIVRRLMIPEPITRFCGVAGSYLGVASNGKVYPCFRHLGLPEYDLGDIRRGVDDAKRRAFLGREAADVDSRPVCKECWARYLCGGGCYADSTVYGPQRLAPQVQHCPFWRTEIDVAIRFYDRLLAADPTYCLRLFGDDPALILNALDEAPGFLQRKNCS